MTNNYFHEARGDYDIVQQRIRLNFKALAGDPIQAQLTMMHEWVHRLLADNDFGQASKVFYTLIPHFTKLHEDEVMIMGNILYDNQKFVQEGFATFIQYGRLLNLRDRETTEQWRIHAVNPEYQRYVNELLFVFDLTQEERDLFSGKVSYLAMETGIRKKAVEQNLFRESNALKTFISDEDNNPNARLHIVAATIKADKSVLYKAYHEIAAASGISYNFPSTKEEIAEFLNYATGFTNIKKHYASADISDALPASEAITQSMDKMIVANLSMNLQSSIVEFAHKEFLYYADKMEVIFITHHNDTWEDWDFIKSQTKRNPEIGMIAFLPTGEKIVTYATKEEASNLLNNQLKHLTLITHWNLYNATTDKVLWSETVRYPDIVIYDTSRNMDLMLKAVTKWTYQNKVTNFMVVAV